MPSELLIPAPNQPIGFPISPKKLAVMHIATFGLYDIYWGYKNFANTLYPGRNGWAWILCSLFLPITLHSLLKRFNELSAHFGQAVRMRQILLALAYFSLSTISNIACNSKSNSVLLMIPMVLMLIPLWLAQVKINEINRAARPDLAVDGKFNVANIIGIVLGAIMWLLVIAGTFLPNA